MCLFFSVVDELRVYYGSSEQIGTLVHETRKISFGNSGAKGG